MLSNSTLEYNHVNIHIMSFEVIFLSMFYRYICPVTKSKVIYMYMAYYPH